MVEAPVLAPGEVTIDQDAIKAMEEEMQTAENMPLPDGDDDF